MSIDPRRVVRLEEAVKALHAQVNVLISEVRTLSAHAAAEAAAAEPQGLPPLSAPPLVVPPVAPSAPPAADATWVPPTPPVPNTPLFDPRPANRQWAAPLGSAGAPPRSEPAERAPAADYSGSIAGGAPPPLPPGLRPARPQPDAPRPRPQPQFEERERMSLETFIGKYFMLGGAVLLLLTGIGYLIAWSIANQMLTPAGRVGLGALAAAAFVAAGFYARAKDERRWGGIMLSIALAITHTVAWGAGPKLQIVDPKLALGLAAIASILLAALALVDEDETLYVVGVGGALLAPFVTQSGRSSAPFTLLYGWIVITAGLFAMRGQKWRTATTVMSIAGMLYAGVGIATVLTGGSTHTLFLDRTSPSFFALACTWSAAILASDEYRRSLTRSYLVTMVLAVVVAAAQVAGKNLPDLPPIALAGTVSAYLILRPTLESVEHWLLDAIAIPLGFLAGALISAGGIDAPNGVAITLLWGAAAGGAALLNERDRRGPHYLVFGLTTWASVAYLLRGDDMSLGLGMIAHAIAMILLMRKERSEHVALPAVVSLVSALVQSASLLSARPNYIATPFLNPGALLLLLSLLTWWRFFGAIAMLAGSDEEPDPQWKRVARTFIAVALFLWGWRELAHTISRDVATSLVTIYFALVGVGAIHYGRIRAIPIARHTGLGLCVVAAWMAVARASGVEAIQIKVGTFVLASLFLLVVAYWYRKERSA
jgi:hypothetical protein